MIAPTASISYLYMMEVVEENKKKKLNFITFALDALDIIFIAIIWYFYKSAKGVLIIYFVHLIINFASVLLIPESPHFLYSKWKFEELRECFNNYSKFNNGLMINSDIKFSKEMNTKQNVVEDSSFRALISDKSRLVNLLAMAFIWCSCSFCFYFIGYFVKYLEGDMYTNTIMMGVADLYAALLTQVAQSYLSTKKGFFYSFIFVAMVTVIYFQINEIHIYVL